MPQDDIRSAYCSADTLRLARVRIKDAPRGIRFTTDDLPLPAGTYQVNAGIGKLRSVVYYTGLPIDARTTRFDALVAASGKCLEGVPGMGFVVLRKAVLESCAGHSQSLAMDLHDQWQYMEKTGQWRFTPPTHVMVALAEAVRSGKVAGVAFDVFSKEPVDPANPLLGLTQNVVTPHLGASTEEAQAAVAVANLCVLGNLSLLLGRKLLWDGKKKEIIGDEEARRLMSRPQRYPYVL